VHLTEDISIKKSEFYLFLMLYIIATYLMYIYIYILRRMNSKIFRIIFVLNVLTLSRALPIMF